MSTSKAYLHFASKALMIHVFSGQQKYDTINASFCSFTISQIQYQEVELIPKLIQEFYIHVACVANDFYMTSLL